jgi:hypothetical protein
MASMRLNQRLLDLAGVAEKNARLKAYEEARQAINRKAPISGPVHDWKKQSPSVQSSIEEKESGEWWDRGRQAGRIMESPDGESYSVYLRDGLTVHTPDMSNEVFIDREDAKANLSLALKLLGMESGAKTQDELRAASELMGKAKDKFGSVDEMRMRQILRYADNEEESVPLPAKGSR